MASARRAAGEGHENAEKARARLRKDAAIERENVLLELYARGLTMREIQAEMAQRFKLVSLSNLYVMLPRALARRAEQLAQGTVDQARALYLERAELLWRAMAPRALGLVTDPDSGTSLPADVRAGELALKILDRMAEVSGAKERPSRPDIQINIGVPDDPETARQRVLEQLRKEAIQVGVIEGQLASVGSTLHALTTGEEREDALPPPVAAREEAA